MDEKSKKKKKLKQKQSQRQKQKQSVIVNVNLAKSRKKSSGQRFQMPPPVHKVYASPIHDLIPQMFNKEGKQASQPTLAEQIQNYLQNQEQSKQGNVLGSPPSQILASSQISSVKKVTRSPLRQNLQPDEQLVVYPPSETDIELPEPIIRKKPGPKKGTKYRKTPKVTATEVAEPLNVYGVAETIAEPGYDDTKQIPDEFMREQWLLRQPQSNPNENRYENLFTSPKQYDAPLNEPSLSKKEKRKLKKTTLNIQEEEEEY